MDEEIRKQLAKPFGPLMRFEEALPAIARRKGLLIAVGDRTILNLLAQGIRPDVGIYDGIIRREPIAPGELERIEQAGAEGTLLQAKNPAGAVSAAMETEIINALGAGRGWIRIDGEDDLASLVVMAEAKEGSLLLYGQPKEGVIVVKIDAEMKKKAKALRERIRE